LKERFEGKKMCSSLQWRQVAPGISLKGEIHSTFDGLPGYPHSVCEIVKQRENKTYRGYAGAGI